MTATDRAHGQQARSAHASALPLRPRGGELVARLWALALCVWLLCLHTAPPAAEANILGYSFRWLMGCKYSRAYYERDLTASTIRKSVGAHLNKEHCVVDGVIGQPLAFELLPYAVYGHMANTKPRKPLVVVLAGSQGTGKTTFERSLRELLFSDTACVTVVNCADYYNSKHPQRVSDEIRKKVATAVASCPRTMVVIDEIHYLSEGPLDMLLSFLGANQPVSFRMGEGQGWESEHTVDFSQAIVVMTTNDGGNEIIAKALEDESAKEGADGRELLDSDAFVEVVKAFFAKKNKRLAEKSIVDLFVPFVAATKSDGQAYMKLHLRALDCAGRRDKWFDKLMWTSNVEWILPSLICNGGVAASSNMTDLCVGRYLIDGLGGVKNLFQQKVYAPVRRLVEEQPKWKSHHRTVLLSVKGMSIVVEMEYQDEAENSAATKSAKSAKAPKIARTEL